MTAPQILLAVAGLAMVGLGVVIAIDKGRPLDQLDDRPEPDLGPWLGDDDLDRRLNERIAAESRLYRRTNR